MQQSRNYNEEPDQSACLYFYQQYFSFYYFFFERKDSLITSKWAAVYFSYCVVGIVAEAATTRASRRSKRVTRGQPATPIKIESDTSHKIWRHPDRYFSYSLI